MSETICRHLAPRSICPHCIGAAIARVEDGSDDDPTPAETREHASAPGQIGPHMCARVDDGSLGGHCEHEHADEPAPVTDAEIAEVERLDREATPGPWRVSTEPHEERPRTNEVCDLVNNTWVITNADLHPFKADAAFIARARSLLPRLAADIRRTRAAYVYERHEHTRKNALYDMLMRDVERLETERDDARRAAATYQRDSEHALEIAAEESDARDHDDAIVMHNGATRSLRWQRTRETLRATESERDRLHDVCEHTQDDLARARAINEQAEKVRDENDRLVRNLDRERQAHAKLREEHDRLLAVLSGKRPVTP